jgi:hypothetical protein
MVVVVKSLSINTLLVNAKQDCKTKTFYGYVRFSQGQEEGKRQMPTNESSKKIC